MDRDFIKKFWPTCPSEPGFLMVMELKDPTPAPPDIGAIEEKPRRHAHTVSRPGKKLWPLLIACQTRIFLGISINYRYDPDNEMWFGRGPALKNSMGQRILNFDGEIFWSSLIQDG
jgi:hypothetical protein